MHVRGSRGDQTRRLEVFIHREPERIREIDYLRQTGRSHSIGLEEEFSPPYNGGMADFPYLRRECVAIRGGALDRDAVLREIAALALQSDQLAGYGEAEVFNALKAREDQSSTGLEHGLAIPHCRLDRVSEFVVGILLMETGVEFGALDGRPSRAFVFIIGPTAQRELHIRILAAISRGLSQSRAREELLSAGSAGEAAEIFSKHVALPEAEDTGERSQMTIFVQSEHAYESVMEIFSNPVYGNAMVVDAAAAGRSLRSLPLFSAFWTDRPEDVFKVVLAVVPKAMTNEIIRKLHLATDEKESDVLVTVQDLAFVSGRLRL